MSNRKVGGVLEGLDFFPLLFEALTFVDAKS